MNDVQLSPIGALGLSASTKFREDYVGLSRGLFHAPMASNRLHHSGEFGRYRENLIGSLLAAFMPARLAVGSGFLASATGERSTQCDIVLYDRDQTPCIEVAGGRVMYPVETSVAVGEAKSVLSIPELKEALQALMETKRMRATMPIYSAAVAPVSAFFLYSSGVKVIPEATEQQNLVTFLVCERITWRKGREPCNGGLPDLLDEINDRNIDDFHLRANFVLSLEDGLLSYSQTHPSSDRPIPYPYPRHGETDSGWRWLPATPTNDHVLCFVTELSRVASEAWVFEFLAQMHNPSPEAFAFQYFPL
nr:DUF6602 domain-containing protein [Luteibacter rhizovicinus]